MPSKAKLVTRGISTSTVSADSIPKGSGLSNDELDSNFLNLRDASIGIAADDSTVIDLGLGNTLKVAGGTGITTAVSGQTLTITGTSQAQGITFVGDDSTGTRISDGESVKFAGGGGTTVSVSGDVVTITAGNIFTGGSLGNLTVVGDTLTSAITNSDIAIAGNGTGGIKLNDYGRIDDSIYMSVNSIDRQAVEFTNSNTAADQYTVLRARGTGDYQNRNAIQLDSCSGNIFLYTTNSSDIVNLVTVAGAGTSNSGLSLKIGLDNASNITIDRNDHILIYPLNGQIILGSGNTEIRIQTQDSNRDIIIDPNGTGTLDLAVPTSATIGANGAASALTANPVGYLKIKVNGTAYQLPYYNI